MKHFLSEVRRTFFEEGGSGGPLVFAILLGTVIAVIAAILSPLWA